MDLHATLAPFIRGQIRFQLYLPSCTPSRLMIVYILLLSVSILPTHGEHESPPVFLPAPIPDYYLPENFWCSTPGASSLSGLLIRISFYLHALSLFISWLFAPSAQPYIITSLCVLIASLCPILLSHTSSKYQMTLGSHPIALEYFIFSYPAYMCLLLTTPLQIPDLNTHSNLGLTFLCFLTQTCAIAMLAGTTLYLSLFPGNVWKKGMDFRPYSLIRPNRNADYTWGPDINETELLFKGENLCGRRIALFGTLEIKLESVAWRGFNAALGILALLIWLFISACWIGKVLGYLFLSKSIHKRRTSSVGLQSRDNLPFWASRSRRRNSSRAILNLATGNGDDEGNPGPGQLEVSIEDTLPSFSAFNRLFVHGTLPQRTPLVSARYIESQQPTPSGAGIQGEPVKKFQIQLKRGRIPTLLRQNLNFQLPFLDPPTDHFRIWYGLRNRTNLPWLFLIFKIIMIIGVITSVEKTISRYHVIYDSGEIWSAGGAIAIGLGAACFLSSILGWIGELIWWRLVGFVGAKVSKGKELGRFGASRARTNGDGISSPLFSSRVEDLPVSSARMAGGLQRSRFRETDLGGISEQ